MKRNTTTAILLRIHRSLRLTTPHSLKISSAAAAARNSHADPVRSQ